MEFSNAARAIAQHFRRDAVSEPIIATSFEKFAGEAENACQKQPGQFQNRRKIEKISFSSTSGRWGPPWGCQRKRPRAFRDAPRTAQERFWQPWATQSHSKNSSGTVRGVSGSRPDDAGIRPKHVPNVKPCANSFRDEFLSFWGRCAKGPRMKFCAPTQCFVRVRAFRRRDSIRTQKIEKPSCFGL